MSAQELVRIVELLARQVSHWTPERWAAPAAPGDEQLTVEELACVSLFKNLKKAPSFEKFPGATFLRKAPAGRIICEQGDKGSTAFYVLTADDVVALREMQLAKIREVRQAPPDQREELHTFFSREADSELEWLAQEFERELEEARRLDSTAELP